MRDHVDAWVPPSKDHDGLKKFMLDQISASSSDWYVNYHTEELAKWKKMDNITWLNMHIQNLTYDIDYHQDKITKENISKKAQGDPNEWVRLLKESL
jgi:hypothetical protein